MNEHPDIETLKKFKQLTPEQKLQIIEFLEKLLTNQERGENE